MTIHHYTVHIGFDIHVSSSHRVFFSFLFFFFPLRDFYLLAHVLCFLFPMFQPFHLLLFLQYSFLSRPQVDCRELNQISLDPLLLVMFCKIKEQGVLLAHPCSYQHEAHSHTYYSYSVMQLYTFYSLTYVHITTAMTAVNHLVLPYCNMTFNNFI